MLKEIKRILKPGGIIYLETINQRSWAFRCFKENYLGIGSHIYAFSYQSLNFICEKAGLRIKKIRYGASKGVATDCLKNSLKEKQFFCSVLLGNKILRACLVKCVRLLLCIFRKGDALAVYIQNIQ
jgi:2-polyprenyl-3-methyl-5-hydroxy-6-metoxy-1,4-benzoquinol methylase